NPWFLSDRSVPRLRSDEGVLYAMLSPRTAMLVIPKFLNRAQILSLRASVSGRINGGGYAMTEHTAGTQSDEVTRLNAWILDVSRPELLSAWRAGSNNLASKAREFLRRAREAASVLEPIV